jgi:hypothetical protein
MCIVLLVALEEVRRVVACVSKHKFPSSGSSVAVQL